MNLLEPKNELEQIIMKDVEWKKGVEWGMVRLGHPEGRVKNHIVDVLKNIEHLQGLSQDNYDRLRLIAIIHDTFKYKIDITKPKIGRNNHAVIARIFAEKYIEDPDVLRIIEQHDEAFNAWKSGKKSGDWEKAKKRLHELLNILGRVVDLYYIFYKCDNNVDGKDQECVKWFESFLNIYKMENLPTPQP